MAAAMPPPSADVVEKDKVLVLGVEPDVSEELLGLYIHTATKVEVHHLEIRPEILRALVVLKESFGECFFEDLVVKNGY